MPTTALPPIDPKTVHQITAEYRLRWKLRLYPVRPDGTLAAGRTPCGDGICAGCNAARAFAVEEALRWGEPTVSLCPQYRLLWAVPLMHNARLLGGLVASASEDQAFPNAGDGPPLDIRRACTDLRLLAEAANVTNAAALAARRQVGASEQQRAYALHAFKQHRGDTIRALYLRDEPALLAAIRAEDRARAHSILWQTCEAIRQHADGRFEVVKSYFLELVVTMCRTAVNAGGAPEELLGANYTHMAALARLTNADELAPWLEGLLNNLMDAITRNRQRDPGIIAVQATAYMEQHCGEHLARDEVARAVNVSPSHFSYLLRKESGATFTELLNRMRVERACELLGQTRKPLSLVALECGFQDQSYFTKVFRRYRQRTPMQYRREARSK